MGYHSSRFAAALGAVAMVAALSSCSDDDSEGQTTSETTASEVTTPDNSDTTEAEQSGPNEDVEPVKIGVPAAQTGPFAEFSNASLQAVQLAAEYVNRRGGIPSLDGAAVEIVASDTQSDPGRATQLLQQMGAQGDITAFMGPMTSFEQLANLTTIDRLKIPLCSVGGADELTDFGSDYIFRILNGTEEWSGTVPDFLDFAEDLSGEVPERVTVVNTTAVPGDLMGDDLEESMRERGYDVSRVEYDQAATRDYGPVVSDVASTDPDLVVGYQNGGDAIQFAQAAEQQGFYPRLGYVWVGGGHNLPTFAENAGSYAVGYVDTSQSAGWDEGVFGDVVVDFSAEYEESFGRPMSALEALELSCFSVILQAVEDTGSRDPQDVRDAMAEMQLESDEFFTELFPQAGGVEFSDERENARWEPIYIQLAEGGEQVAIYPESHATGDLVWPAGDR